MFDSTRTFSSFLPLCAFFAFFLCISLFFLVFVGHHWLSRKKKISVLRSASARSSTAATATTTQRPATRTRATAATSGTSTTTSPATNPGFHGGALVRSPAPRWEGGTGPKWAGPILLHLKGPGFFSQSIHPSSRPTSQ